MSKKKSKKEESSSESSSDDSGSESGSESSSSNSSGSGSDSSSSSSSSRPGDKKKKEKKSSGDKKEKKDKKKGGKKEENTTEKDEKDPINALNPISASIAAQEEAVKQKQIQREFRKKNPLQDPGFLDQIKKYYIDIPNCQKYTRALLTNYQDEYTHQGFQENTAKILRKITEDIKDIFAAVDESCPISIENVINTGKKKKLRHLFQALHLRKCEEDSDAPGTWLKSNAVSDANIWSSIMLPFVRDAKLSVEKEWGIDREGEKVTRKMEKKRLKEEMKEKKKLLKAEKKALKGSESKSEGFPLAGMKMATDRYVPGQKGDGWSKEPEHGQYLGGNSDDPNSSPNSGQNLNPVSTTGDDSAVGPALPTGHGSIGPARPPPNTVISRKAPKDAVDGMGPGGTAPDPHGREAWMTAVPDSLAAAFGGQAPEKGDAYEIERTAEELQNFENAFKNMDKAPSLFDQARNLSKDERKKQLEKAKKAMAGDSEIWGQSAKNQEAILKRQKEEDDEINGVDGGEKKTKLRKMFDPSTDMDSKRGMSGADFQKLIGGTSKLNSMFAKGEVTNSFL